MHAIYGNNDDSIGLLIAGYFNRSTGYPITGPFTAMGWVKENNIIGQAIFTDYTGANIEIHLNFPNGLTRSNIKNVYNYVFKILDCERLTAKPYCTNQKLLQLLKRLGFEYEYTQEKYYKEGNKIIDAVVYKLTKNNIPKWLVRLNLK